MRRYVTVALLEYQAHVAPAAALEGSGKEFLCFTHDRDTAAHLSYCLYSCSKITNVCRRGRKANEAQPGKNGPGA